ncbi:hypothetical protein JN531_015575 [Flagellatimonas centrodinii]|uniref:hypothetical protein n=1 Tax=Flagellatimonas centrodinii TaxID=2806210 RepID=UPI001FFACE99|nr:hypothetical protein [Flagellatimonas centrodinii]ULQ46506.1 hypothetical protein JN531_015575 [Flagellatimonas centrodinii]
MHLHLDENTARQVRVQAHRWGLNDTQTVKQLIRLGLDASRDNAGGSAAVAELSAGLNRIAQQLQIALLENMQLTRECYRALHPKLSDEQRMERYKAMRKATLETLQKRQNASESAPASPAEGAISSQ